MKPKNEAWKCERCGRCCKFLCLKTPELTEDDKVWLNAHNGIKVSNGNSIIIRSQCAFLRHSGRLYRCALHNTPLKPIMCQNGGEKECIRHNKAFK